MTPEQVEQIKTYGVCVVCKSPRDRRLTVQGDRRHVTELPAVEIAEAAGRVRRLWPQRHHDDDEPEPEPDPPQLPAGSWFAG